MKTHSKNLIQFTGWMPVQPIGVTIVNKTGQVVHQKQYAAQQQIAAGKQLSKGEYWVQIKTQKGTT